MAAGDGLQLVLIPLGWARQGFGTVCTGRIENMSRGEDDHPIQSFTSSPWALLQLTEDSLKAGKGSCIHFTDKATEVQKTSLLKAK